MNPTAEVEQQLARWLRTHHGIISWAEALNLGASPALIRVKVERGIWERVLLGIYRAASSPRDHRQDLRAACLATGGASSHESAAWLLGLVKRAPDLPAVTIIRGRHARVHPEYYRLHVSRDLGFDDSFVRGNIRVTKPVRTLVDLAGCSSPLCLTEAVDTALSHRIVRLEDIEGELNRLSKQGRPGVRALRQHLNARGFAGAPRPSVLEAHARRLIVSLQIPRPEVEVRAGKDGQYRLDIAWRDVLLAVEIDGYAWHFSPAHKRRDEARRQRLREANWTILVFDWHQVLYQADLVASEILATYQRLRSELVKQAHTPR